MPPAASFPRVPLRSWLPGLGLARRYQTSWLGGDVGAGLALTALLVPQGMAYAELAGLPPVTGLYTTVLSLVAYAVFGPSRILVLGPDSSLGPLIAATVLPLAAADGDPGRAVALAGLLALMMGAICIAAGVARLGTVAELLSRPVRVGYLNGLAIVILAGQLPKLFGFGVDADRPLAEFGEFIRGVWAGAARPAAVIIGGLGLALILLLRRRRPRFPGVLAAIVGSTLAVVFLEPSGLALVGPVPAGFPFPRLPDVSAADIGKVFLGAVGMAFVTLADTTALSRAFAAESGDAVDPNHEIAALGFANLASGLFQGFPLSASSSRTAVAKTAGAHTQLVGLIGAASIVVILIVANGLTSNVPSTALAAIVMAAALSLLDVDEMRFLWRVRRTEFAVCVAAILGVVTVGVLEGIVVAIALSLGDFIRRAWRPHDAILGRVAGRKGYHDLERHPEGEQVPGLVIYRFDAPMFFANARFFADRIIEIIESRGAHPVRRVVVAGEPITDIDTSGAEILQSLLDQLDERGIEFGFAALKGPVKDRLARYGIFERIGEASFYPTVGAAVSAFLAATGTEWDDPVDRPRGP